MYPHNNTVYRCTSITTLSAGVPQRLSSALHRTPPGWSPRHFRLHHGRLHLQQERPDSSSTPTPTPTPVPGAAHPPDRSASLPRAGPGELLPQGQRGRPVRVVRGPQHPRVRSILLLLLVVVVVVVLLLLLLWWCWWWC